MRSAGTKRPLRTVAFVVDWMHQRKEVVQHMHDCQYGTLEVVGR
jgi:hypothetical protein